MIVVTNRIPVAVGHEIDFEDRFRKRVHLVADLPLADSIPIKFGSVRTGPRSVSWRTDEPATLTWVEALDGGDAGRKTDERDALYQLRAPFDQITLLKED